MWVDLDTIATKGFSTRSQKPQKNNPPKSTLCPPKMPYMPYALAVLLRHPNFFAWNHELYPRKNLLLHFCLTRALFWAKMTGLKVKYEKMFGTCENLFASNYSNSVINPFMPRKKITGQSFIFHFIRLLLWETKNIFKCLEQLSISSVGRPREYNKYHLWN